SQHQTAAQRPTLKVRRRREASEKLRLSAASRWIQTLARRFEAKLHCQADEKVTRVTMSVPMCILRRSPRPRVFRDRYSRGPREQGPQPDQVVRGGSERHDPVDQLAAAVPQLAQTADGLHPAEDLLNQLPSLLADRVAGVPRRPPINRAAFDLLRHVRCDTTRTDVRHEAGDVETLVAADCHR